jgi:hypothetical protein
VHVKERDGNNRLTGSTRIGRLNLVDLSGSENRKRAGGPGVGVRVPLICCNIASGLKVFSESVLTRLLLSFVENI